MDQEDGAVTIIGYGPASPNHHRMIGIIGPRLRGNGPFTPLLRGGDGSNNHGGGNHVAAHRVNNNRGRTCHVISFGHGGSNVPTIIRHLRCSPGHSTGVTLILCGSNRHHCVLTPGNLGTNSRVRSNISTTVGPNGALPVHGVPINSAIRGMRVGPNGNNRLTHSTNACIRVITHSNTCIALHLHSNRVHGMRTSYHTALNRINGTRRVLHILNGTNTTH